MATMRPKRPGTSDPSKGRGTVPPTGSGKQPKQPIPTRGGSSAKKPMPTSAPNKMGGRPGYGRVSPPGSSMGGAPRPKPGPGGPGGTPRPRKPKTS